MADHALINSYLDELRHMLRRSAEADDIVAEVADHLLEGVFRRREQGLALLVAERSVLAEFGDPMLVGRAFASSKHGGIAVPTTFTKKAGLLGILAAVLFVGAALAKVVDNATNNTDWDAGWFRVSFFLFPAAGLLLVALVVGLNRRHGGALSGLGRTATYVLGASAITSVVGVFYWGPWLTLLLVGSALLGVGLRESRLAPFWTVGAMIAGSSIAAATMWVQWVLPIARQDFGDDPTIWLVAVGFLVFATGVFGIGNWLRAETPVDEPDKLLTV